MRKSQDFSLPGWTGSKLFAFRFFFVFFSLKIILSPNFWSYLIVRDDLKVWAFFERINTPVCLWLNDRFFHFDYSPGWTSFTGPLKIIQGLVFIVIAVTGAGCWGLATKAKEHNRLKFWFDNVLRSALVLSIFSYAIIKIIPVQMPAPGWILLNTRLGDLTPSDLFWATMGYGTSYQVFSGICETVCALLILFPRTKVAGLLVLTGILGNVIIVNYTFHIGVVQFSLLLLSINLYLLFPYFKPLYGFFLLHEPVSLARPKFQFRTPWKRRAAILVPLLIILISVGTACMRALRWYQDRRTSILNTRIYKVDHSTPLIDTTGQSQSNWQYVIRGTDRRSKEYIAFLPADVEGIKYYYVTGKDSLNRGLTVQPRGGNDSTRLLLVWNHSSKDKWSISLIGDGKINSAVITQINPDTSLTLLKDKPPMWEY